uniref:Uncharacterized protein n=1 Tax=Anguilla anguilla TaxID=7936 RepID=A0A0E9XIV0_ANGAN
MLGNHTFVGLYLIMFSAGKSSHILKLILQKKNMPRQCTA